MTVFKIETTGIVVISVFDLDNRNGTRTDILNQSVFDRLPAVFVSHAADDLFIAARFVLEEIELADQPFGQITPQEGAVSFDFAHFKEFFPGILFLRSVFFFFLGIRLAPTPLDIFPDLHADMIGIEPAGDRTQNLGMPNKKFNLKALGELQSLKNAFVPEARPAFVHDLGFNLWNKILGLFVDDGEQVFFPLRNLRIVVANKKQDIFFRFNRNLGQIGRYPLLAPVDGLKWVVRRFRITELGILLLYFGLLPNREIASALKRKGMSG